METQVSLALLVGGRSRRMGRDKAFVDVGGQPLIERLRDRLALAFGHAFIVAKDTRRFRTLGLPVVADALPQDSPTVGVYSAVLAAPTRRVLCLGVDLPFVTREMLTVLAARSEGFEAYVPSDGSGLQPLCAVYAKQTLPALEGMLDQDERRLDLIFDRVRTGFLDVREAGLGDPAVLFMNINTPADLETARQLAEGSGESGRGSPAVGGPEGAFAPRVREFVRSSPLPTVSFVGKKKSGKTAVLVGVIAELVRRGRRVAVVKSDRHGFAIDVPGTDTFRLREAGADVTAIASPEHVAVMSRVARPVPLLGLVWRLREPVDVVLTEGFASQPAPKIEVSRAARSDSLIAPPDELLAIVTDQRFPDHAVPQLGLEDFDAMADLLDRQIDRHRAGRAGPAHEKGKEQ
jgi:molybdopterin-guanine dinucleotide biosynthesis protein B/molybdopterin-guanine dinucleotide biosynthesis protein